MVPSLSFGSEVQSLTLIVLMELCFSYLMDSALVSKELVSLIDV